MADVYIHKFRAAGVLVSSAQKFFINLIAPRRIYVRSWIDDQVKAKSKIKNIKILSTIDTQIKMKSKINRY